jgi:nucleoporin NUP2
VAPAASQSASTSSAPSFSFGAPAPLPTTIAKPAEAAPTPVAAPVSKPTETSAIDTEEKYLTSIRGLNTSVIRALEVALKQDPFLDLGEALRRVEKEYRTHLREIKKEAGKPMNVEVEQAEKTGMEVDKVPAATEQAAPAASASAVVQPPKVGAFTLPAPSASTSSASATTGGFKPAAPVMGFSFGGKTIDVASKPASESAPAASPFVSKPVEDKTATKPQATTAAAALVQGMLDEPPAPATEQTDKSPATPSSKAPSFSFGSTTPTASPAPPTLNKRSSAIFAIKPEVRKSTGGDASSMVIPPSSGGSNPVPFIFKASNTGFNMGSSGATAPSASTSTPAPATTATSGFSFSPAKARQSSAGFSFGKADTQPPAAAAGDASSATKPAPFSFGAPATSGFSFGKPAETAAGGAGASKPVPSFSFGAPPAASGTATSAPKPPVFSFGASAAASGSSSPAPVTSTETEGAEQAEGSDPAAQSANLTTGQGEEDEETLWENKAQIGTLTTNDEGKKVWTDWRVCKVKLKRENKKEGQADSQPMRRLLMRVDPSGHVYQVSRRV